MVAISRLILFPEPGWARGGVVVGHLLCMMMAHAYRASAPSGMQLALLAPWHHCPGATPGLEVARTAGEAKGHVGATPIPLRYGGWRFASGCCAIWGSDPTSRRGKAGRSGLPGLGWEP